MSISTTRSLGSLSAEARLRLRRDALRAAVTRGQARDAAWSAARSRLHQIDLDPAEARAARAAVVRFGRALRSARLRRLAPEAAPATSTAARSVGELPRRRERRGWLAAGLVVLALGAIVLWSREIARSEDDGATPAIAAATLVPPLRGRSQPTTPPVVAARAATTVEPSPNSSPPPSDAPVTGFVSGGGKGTSPRTALAAAIIPPEPAPTPRPTPTPMPTPSPRPAVIPPAIPSAPSGPDGLSHVSGRVVDVVTGRPVANVAVCIANGDASCTRAPRTDQDGRWTITLMPATSWSISFIANGYVTSTQPVAARVGVFPLPDIRLARR